MDRHGAALSLYARQWCHAPEDAVQEALIELLRQVHVPDNPVAWLYKVVRCRAMNLARSEHRRAGHQRRAGEQRARWFMPAEDTEDEPVDWEPLLMRLPRLEREIVVARIWGELSLQETGDLVGLPTSSVHRHYYRALSKLERMIDAQHAKSRECEEER